MSRGELGKELLTELAKEMPDLEGVRQAVLNLVPEFIPIKFPPESPIPVAAPCLHDALCTVEEASHAFHEILAHRKWYLETRGEPHPKAAIFFSKFYADDAALRLYSAGEHLANAIIFMLQLTKSDLERYKKKNRVSLQIVVGKYLLNELPKDSITRAVLKLMNSGDWKAMLEYRNTWVHKQPPTVAGLGLVFKRRKRWSVSDDGAMLTFGGGDEPDYQVEDIVSFVRAALFLFIEVLTEVADTYAELIAEKGSTVV